MNQDQFKTIRTLLWDIQGESGQAHVILDRSCFRPITEDEQKVLASTAAKIKTLADTLAKILEGKDATP